MKEAIDEDSTLRAMLLSLSESEELEGNDLQRQLIEIRSKLGVDRAELEVAEENGRAVDPRLRIV